MIIVRIITTLNNKGFSFNISEHNVEEKKSYYHDKDRKKNIKKESILSSIDSDRNYKISEMESFGYCLPKDVEMFKEMLIKKISLRFYALEKHYFNLKEGISVQKEKDHNEFRSAQVG